MILGGNSMKQSLPVIASVFIALASTHADDGIGADLVNASPTPGPSLASHLANISTRMRVGVAENILIGGFIIRGPQPKRMMLRAIGPSLLSSGVTGALTDPVLELHGSNNLMALNDDWQRSSQAGDIQASGLAPRSPYESAMIVTLPSGSYTTLVAGYQDGQGIGLVEAYELDATTTRTVNISTRGFVGLGQNVLIGGFLVEGARPKRAIVRAIGPSLAGTVFNPLQDPTLTVRDQSGTVLASNDNWNTSDQAYEIIATGLAPTNTRESAVVMVYSAGSYTAAVAGVNGATGLAMVEVYDLDP
jgi:hypothetical protein